MSAATAGVAVAVEATIARAPSQRAASAEAEVVGPEVVAPLRHAVRLVDDEQARRAPRGSARGSRRAEALGRDVEQAQLAGGARATAGVGAASCWALTSAASPGAARSSASTWSCMSETSGETTR